MNRLDDIKENPDVKLIWLLETKFNAVMGIGLHTATKKPYENEVTSTDQNLPLKCCQPLEIFTHS